MIYYPINTLIKIGINEILIITTKEDKVIYENLLNNSDFNINFCFEVQEKPNGIPEAFIIGKNFIEKDNVCLILGDNLFFNSYLLNSKLNKSSKIFVKNVSKPNSYGVLQENNRIPKLIHEKPNIHISNYAVVGLYMYNNSVIDLAKELKPSDRGETEITDLNNIYLKNNDCEVIYLEENCKWFDSGTFDSLLDASIYIRKNKI